MQFAFINVNGGSEMKWGEIVQDKERWDILRVAETGQKDNVGWEEHGLQGIRIGREFGEI